jgi:hypothetical protein
MRHNISKTKQLLSSIPNIVFSSMPSAVYLPDRSNPHKSFTPERLSPTTFFVRHQSRDVSCPLFLFPPLLHMTSLHVDTSSINPQMTSALSHPVGLGC